MSTIFISYRHQDIAIVRRLHDRISDGFRQWPKNVSLFMPVSTIQPGADWRDHLGPLQSSDVLLVVITEDWLAHVDRCFKDPEDHVRIEIESALSRRIPVVPVLVDQAMMPTEKDLPAHLKELAYFHADRVRSKAQVFDADVERLIARLSSELRRTEQSSVPVQIRDLDRLTKVRPALEHRRVEALSADLASGLPLEYVDCTVFAPPQAAPKTAFLVQVYIHTPEQRSEAQTQSKVIDDDSLLRGSKSLGLQIKRQTTVGIELVLPNLTIDKPFQELFWNGWTQSAQFGVTVPEAQPLGNIIGTVTVIHASVPIGHLKFKLKIISTASGGRVEPEAVGDQAKHYDVAFVSYSSKDREKVLARVQGILAAGIKCRQDILDLDPGDRWERKLYTYIDECDLFLLFWSKEAKKSEWVLKEVGYALDRKHGDDLAPPEIRPVPLELPLVEPPKELRHLHFNDRLLYLMPESSRSDS